MQLELERGLTEGPKTIPEGEGVNELTFSRYFLGRNEQITLNGPRPQISVPNPETAR